MPEHVQDADLHAALATASEKAALMINATRIIEDLMRIGTQYKISLNQARRDALIAEEGLAAKSAECKILHEEVERFRVKV